MNLRNSTFLFLDCQTTGMHPSTGSLLEFAWGFGNASQTELIHLQSELVQLPEGQKIPKPVHDLTGLQNSDLELAQDLNIVFNCFTESLKKFDHQPMAIVHYAQFEKAFLEKFYEDVTGSKQLPFRFFCSQKLAHRIFPQIPSRNIRGLAGLFCENLGELKRASSHVRATFEIWRRLVNELETQGMTSFEELECWQEKTPKRPKAIYEYQISKELRLKLPKKPGVYFMKSKTGKILYVGKATSLRDRVNSYFRGQKGRDTKKLEMLTQVSDLDFVETRSALEAALLESDEIKRLEPPYNISLKAGSRNLIYYSKSFLEVSHVQSPETPLGPFRPNASIDQLRFLQQSLIDNQFSMIFFKEFPTELLKEAFQLFCIRQNVTLEQMKNLRSQLALGYRLLRKYEKEARLHAEFGESSEIEEEESEILSEENDLESNAEPTAEELSEKFDRLFARGAWELRRSRQLTALLDCHLEWESEMGWRSLEVRHGKFQSDIKTERSEAWQDLGIADYDRMSILQSEISRRDHRLQKLPFNKI